MHVQLLYKCSWTITFDALYLYDGIKKLYDPILPDLPSSRLEHWSGRLQTLLQPVGLLCHSPRGPKSARGGGTGFIQDGGYSREDTGRSLSHLCPDPYGSFSCKCQRWYPRQRLAPIVPTGICYLLSWGRWRENAYGFHRWNVRNVPKVIKSYEYH